MKNTVTLLSLFVFSIFLWIATFFDATVVLTILIGGISLLYILRNRNIEKQDVIVGTLLGILSMPAGWIMGLCTIPAYMCAMSIFRKNGCHKIEFIKSGRRQTCISILLALAVGTFLGILNLLLANTEIHFSVKPQWFLIAAQAGITEEVMFRFFFFAVCVYLVKDEKLSKAQNIFCYLVMVIPHVLTHYNFETIEIGNVIVLSLLFGLPFALLQRKRDLLSAILSHAIVDLIRFAMLGI